MTNRDKQIKYYTELLKENEFLLLKSCDTYFKNHYSSSPLAILTGFLGSEGEALIDKNGKIKIFVDTRYHLSVDKQVFSDIEVYKMPLGESFIEAFKKNYPKNSILYVNNDILFKKYIELDEYFDLRRYTLKKSFQTNKDFNKKAKIFETNKNIENYSFIEKVKKIKNTNKNISRMIIFNLDEISYLTNLRSYQMKYSSNFRSILYLDFKNSNHLLFSDKLPKEIKIEGLKFMSLDDFCAFANSLTSEVYVNLNQINLDNFLSIKHPKELKCNNVSLLASIRPISSIKELMDSFEKLDKAIFNFKKQLKTGLSEYELTKIFEKELNKQGSYGLSFKTILAIEENSASIHYSESSKNKFLKEESLILLDCGGYFNSGYATDITRTFYFGKNPKPIYKKIYTNVLKAFFACYLSKETDCKKLDSLARKMLKEFEKEGFYFAHGLGHGIGTSVHQNPPTLSMLSNDIIKPYQVHSIEPGLYGKNKENIEFGVRLENCVYSDLNFNKISLSKFPFEDVLIDYSLLDEKEKEALKIWQESFNGNNWNNKYSKWLN